MQRGEDEVAGERGADGDIRRLAVANFADHDDVGILTDDVPQPRREGQPDLRIDVDLIDPVHLVFDRIFDRDDLLVRQIDALQRGVERGRFAAAGGAGDQKDAVRQRREMLHAARACGRRNPRRRRS